MTMNPLLLDNQLCFSLYSTSLAVTQIYKPLLEPLGLTYPQYLIMLILWEKEGLGLKDICERLSQKPGALTPVIKRMEKDGLVLRQKNAEDERQLEIYLTDHGRSLKREALAVNACLVSSCNLSLDDLNELKTRLDQLRSQLNSINPAD